MAVRTYDPKSYKVTYGTYVLSGFASDTKVMVEFNEAAWSTQIGVDGEDSRTKSNNRSGKITVRLMQTSPSNDILSGLAEQDRMLSDAALPLQVEDINGNTIHLCENAWIEKIPNAEYGINAGPREWVFQTGVLVSFLGHN